MEQATFAELEHDLKKRRTRRELFLVKKDRMDANWKDIVTSVVAGVPRSRSSEAVTDIVANSH